ncbi:PREDICTED: uncharacterized protein LOC104746646 isoform X2 [Camelina sativa]|uniref:Uncharacterized protein LOC104746646 isoform X2 n=1 Tax=Camelina sativa TaxID=90675 RepID=A0ABM0W6Q1_CAMSA|nr:PREDICTED: uncharacterized protein LOC104746646 isoform X2 [Camelina sativa]
MLVSTDLDKKEYQIHTVAEEKVNHPLGQYIEHLEGKKYEMVSTDFSSSVDHWLTKETDRVWEPGGLPTEFELWDCRENESRSDQASDHIVRFSFPQVLVFDSGHIRKYRLQSHAGTNLIEFRIGHGGNMFITPKMLVHDKVMVVLAQRLTSLQIPRLSLANHVWKPGGVLTELDKWKELESYLWIVYGKNLEVDQKMHSRLVYDVKKDTKFDHSYRALNLQVCCCVGDMKNKKLRNVEAVDHYETTRSPDLIYGIILLEIKPHVLFTSTDIYFLWSLQEERKHNNEAPFDDITFLRGEAMIDEDIWLHLKFEFMFICESLTQPPDSNGNGAIGLISETVRVVLMGILSKAANKVEALGKE